MNDISLTQASLFRAGMNRKKFIRYPLIYSGEMKRTSIVELIDKNVEEKLKLLCSLSSKLWNEVNYAKRRMFFEKKGVDIKATYKEFYEKYKVLIGSATTQQILNKNDEAWKSFFKLLKLKKESKLPPFIT